LQIDFYVGGCHKWLCGGAGAGYLYVRPDLIETLRPRLSGWFGLASPFDYHRETGRGVPHPGILRFLGGTPAIPALYAAREGLHIVAKTGVTSIRETSKKLTQRIVNEARDRELTIRSPLNPQARNGMVCIEVEAGQEIVSKLSEEDIIVDWRPDCGIRISPHFYNDFSDIDRFFETIDTLQKN
jgi:kynureninase